MKRKPKQIIKCDCGNRAVVKKNDEYICARCRDIEKELHTYHEFNRATKMNINSIVIHATVTIKKDFIVSADRLNEDPEGFVANEISDSFITNGWTVTEVRADEEPYHNEN